MVPEQQSPDRHLHDSEMDSDPGFHLPALMSLSDEPGSLGPDYWQNFVRDRLVVSRAGGLIYPQEGGEATFTLRGSKAAPGCTFGLTAPVVRALAAREAEAGRGLTRREMAEIAIAETSGTLSVFGTDTLNIYNRAYYSCEDAWEEQNRPAGTFVRNEPLVRALSRYIQRQVSAPAVRMKELGSGYSDERWPVFCGELEEGRSFEITLTDLECAMDKPVSGEQLDPRVKFIHASEDLLAEFETLPASERYHLMFATYAIDSAWSPRDRNIRYADGQYYMAMQRMRLADTHPRYEDLAAAYRRGEALACSRAADLDGIIIENIYVPVDISLDPLAEFIRNQVERNGVTAMNIPGCLIHKVESAFAKQLAPGGVFILGEVARFRPASDYAVLPYETSGRHAKFRVDDYFLASQILEGRGYEVEVMSLKDLVQSELGASWWRGISLCEFNSIELAHDTNCVFTVRRAR